MQRSYWETNSSPNQERTFWDSCINGNTEAKSGYPAIRDATEATSYRLGCVLRWPSKSLQPQDPLGSNLGGQGLNKLPQSQLKSVCPHQILPGGHAYSSQSMPINVSWDPQSPGISRNRYLFLSTNSAYSFQTPATGWRCCKYSSGLLYIPAFTSKRTCCATGVSEESQTSAGQSS